MPSITIQPPASMPSVDVNVPSFPDINVNAPSFSPIPVQTPTWPSVTVSAPGSWPTIQVNTPTFTDIQINPPASMPSVGWGPTPTVGVNWAGVPTIAVTVPPIGPIPVATPTFSPIQINPPASMPSVTVNWGGAPTINVSWGPTPSITCDCTVTVECPTSSSFRASKPLMGQGGYATGAKFEERDDWVADTLEVEPEILGIPREIIVKTAPNFPRVIKVEHELPEKIDIEGPEIPDHIDVNIKGGEDIPTTIELVSDLQIPNSIELTATDVPRTIALVPKGLPESIRLEVPDDFPRTIRVDGSEIPSTIKVEGIPDTIQLTHDLPEEIFIKKPDDLEIPIVQTAPLDVNVKVDMDIARLVGADEKYHDGQCVMIVPCPKK
jgi:hypothetical protein